MAALDTTIALIDEDEFTAYKQMDASNPNIPSDAIVDAINMASQHITGHCDRTFIIPTNQVGEIFEGDGTNNYFTKGSPISDSGSVTIEYWDGDSWETLSSTTYGREIEASSGEIWFHNGYVFNNKQKYKVQYKPGWARASVPADLKHVCLSLVDRILKIANKKDGLSTESFGDATTTYDLTNLLTEKHKSTLNRYRRRFL